MRLTKLLVFVLAALLGLAPGSALAVQVLPNDPTLPVTGISSGDLTVVLEPGNPYNDQPARPAANVLVELKSLPGYDLNSPSSRMALAEKTLQELLREAAEESVVASARTDATGRVVFRDLPIGIYAVTAPGPDPVFHPLVAIIPAWDNTAQVWTRQAEVHPKMRGQYEVPVTSTSPQVPPPPPLSDASTTPPPPTVPEDDPIISATEPMYPRAETPREQSRLPKIGKLAQTGADVVVYALIAIALLLTGWFLVARAKKGD